MPSPSRWGPVVALFLALLSSPLRAEVPDLVVLHGGGSPEALAIREGRIAALGSSLEIAALAGPGTRVLDARGGSLRPGFVDAHVHLLSAGMGLRGVALQATDPPERIQERLREALRTRPGEGWLVGRGWSYDAFGRRLPDRALIDEVVPDRPVYLRCSDGHTGLANRLALHRAGVTAETPDPPGGAFGRDPLTGELTGVVQETAEEVILRAIPPPTDAEREEGLRAAVREAWRVGVTSVGDAGVTFDEFRTYQALRERGELGLRVSVALQLDDPESEAELARAEELRARYRDDPFLRVRAMKLFVDGVVEVGTAFLVEPYADGSGRGRPLLDQVTLDRTVRRLAKRGWQVWMHAIGDGAVRMALDALERAGDVRDGRHRVEHAELVAPPDRARMARLGVLASQQPRHGSPDALDSWRRSLGPPRDSQGWAHRSLLRAGVRLAFGSDWPVVPLDPLPMLQVAVARSAGGRSWSPEERLDLGEALEACTSGGAYANFDEARLGALQVGRLADVVVLSRELRSLEDLDRARVLATIVEGRLVYEALP